MCMLYSRNWQSQVLCFFFEFVQTVAVAVFAGLAFSFYVFFIPFVGNRILKFHIYAVFSPVVSNLCFFGT